MRIMMVKRLQIILVLVLAAMLASPAAGGFASSADPHGIVASVHGHDHDADVLSDDVTQNDAERNDGHGKSHDASDHVPGNILPVHVHDQLSISPVMPGNTLKASKTFDEQPLERPPRLMAHA